MGYYGETIKSFNTRISRHKYNVSRFKRCNANDRYILDKNHSIDWNNSFYFSSIIKMKKPFKWWNPFSSQSCQTLHCDWFGTSYSMISFYILKSRFPSFSDRGGAKNKSLNLYIAVVSNVFPGPNKHANVI